MNTANASVPLQPLVSGQLLCLPTHCQVGLIFQYRYYAGFAGAGAAVGGYLDVKSLSIYPIGTVCFELPETYQQRQQAFQQRIAYAQTLCKIAAVHAPLQRAYLLVRQLCLWLDPKDVIAIPYELLGQLVGVLPRNIDIGWQQYLQLHSAKDPRLTPLANLTRNDRSYAQSSNPDSIQVSVGLQPL
jgi:hypothetical protein